MKSSGSLLAAVYLIIVSGGKRYMQQQRKKVNKDYPNAYRRVMDNGGNVGSKDQRMDRWMVRAVRAVTHAHGLAWASMMLTQHLYASIINDQV